MQITVVDYSAHPYRVALSRALGERGHQVVHCRAAERDKKTAARFDGIDYPAGLLMSRWPRSPTGEHDPAVLVPLQDEHVLEAWLSTATKGFKPEVIIAIAVPDKLQRHLQRLARAGGAKFVAWVEQAKPYHNPAHPNRGILQTVVEELRARAFSKALRMSDHVIVGTFELLPALVRYHVPFNQVTVIEDWGPPVSGAKHPKLPILAEPAKIVCLFRGEPTEAWAGVKMLATRLPNAELHVLSGAGCMVAPDDGLEAYPTVTVHPGLSIEEWHGEHGQPSALLVALSPQRLDESVPSAFLWALSNGCPVIALADSSSSAARIVERSGAGVAVLPDDIDGAAWVLASFAGDPDRYSRFRQAGTDYAKAIFDPEKVADRVERVFQQL